MFNYSALRKWRKRCNLTQKDVADALGLKNHTSITVYEKGGSLSCENLSTLIDLFSSHLSTNQKTEFLAELLEVKIGVASELAQADIHFTKWIEDKDRIINILEKELNDCKKIIDYAKKTCKDKNCPIVQLIKKPQDFITS